MAGRFNVRGFGVNGTFLSGPGTLSLIRGFNPGAATRYLMLFDVAALAPGLVPYDSILVTPGSTFSLGLSSLAEPFVVKGLWGVSDTPDTFTQSLQVFWVRSEAFLQ